MVTADTWLEQNEAEAVIAVALNQVSWAELADAAAISPRDAEARWAGQLDPYAAAGILPAMTDEPPTYRIPPMS